MPPAEPGPPARAEQAGQPAPLTQLEKARPHSPGPSPEADAGPVAAQGSPRDILSPTEPPRPPEHQGPAALATSVVRQIAAAMPLRLEDRPVEISLEPAELGRIRMTVAAHHGVPTLVIAAERPETLDLMRRHADLLTGTFGEVGFSGMDLSSGPQTGGDPSPDDRPAPPPAGARPEEPALAPGPTPVRLTVPPLDRLDLRL